MTGDQIAVPPDAELEVATPRLRLIPLTIGDAEALHPVLADPVLYTFTGQTAPTFDEVRDRLAIWESRRSPDGRRAWLNWSMRQTSEFALVGWMQVTLEPPVAELAWLVGPSFQGRGYASEAVRALVSWLPKRFPIDEITAHIHPENAPSHGVARRAGLSRTDVVEAGENLWRLTLPRG